MLQAHDAPDSFLEKPAAALGLTIDAPAGARAANAAPSEALGTRIGPYKLLEQIGAGGMGVVYVAEQQEPVRRLVALKIIRPGMDSTQVLARFEAGQAGDAVEVRVETGEIREPVGLHDGDDQGIAGEKFVGPTVL